jgi:hypothetical protein
LIFNNIVHYHHDDDHHYHHDDHHHHHVIYVTLTVACLATVGVGVCFSLAEASWVKSDAGGGWRTGVCACVRAYVSHFPYNDSSDPTDSEN